MDLLATLGRIVGFSFSAGINLYATVALLGLASRHGWVDLPPQFRVFDNDVVIWAALGLYVVEFLADKIPWVDSAWDFVHTLIRPVGGALIAVAALGDASPTVEGLVALLGGAIAAGTHFTKAGTRVIVNTSPEPFSNWILSLAEDVFVVALGFLALEFPAATVFVVVALIVLMIVFAGVLWRAARRWLLSWQSGGPRPGRRLDSPRHHDKD